MMHGYFGYLAEMGGIQGVSAALRTDIKHGIYEDECQEGTFAKRKATYGTNLYPKPPLTPFLEHCWELLQDPMLIVLCIAGVVSIIIGFIEEPESGWIEGLAILMAVVLVTLIGAVNNYKQELQFRKLDEGKKKPESQVVRFDKISVINSDDVLVGDLVMLSAGDFIPADGILVTNDSVKVNEAAMTGESDDIQKDFNDPFLKSGTELREGQCLMLVTAVGIKSSYGRIMDSLATKAENTPLQDKLEDVARLVGYIGGGVAVVLFLVLTIFWIVEIVNHDLKVSEEAHELLDFFIIAVTIVVVAVPEGLPLAVTISLAYSMAKMQDDQNLVRVLSACETMGNATTICSDKTGTLTQGVMTVVKAFIGTRLHDKMPPKQDISEPLRKLIIGSVVVNSKTYIEPENMDNTVRPETWKWKGDSTERSLMSWLIRHQIDIDGERERNIVEKNYPFDSGKKMSSVILKHGSVYRHYYKGAAERVLAMCSKSVDEEGNELEMSPDSDLRMETDKTILGFTSSGLRTIGFSYVDHDHIEVSDDGSLIDPPDRMDCVFIGVVGIKDPLRPEAAAAVLQCQNAGIVVRMVTGDHLKTAEFIAKECGIVTDSDYHIVMEGEQLRAMFRANRTEELEATIPRLRVLARSQPEDKKELVAWLKAHSNIVAATGDGTNDAPALKEANVGLAMALSGTEVAKRAAEIQILDDNFASIVKAVMWGRSVYDNIRKFVQFQLTVNVTALLISLIGAFTKYTNPLKAVQLLWVNLIMDTMAALALGTELPTMKLLQRRPYHVDSPLISHVMWRNILGQGAYQVAALCFILYGGDIIFPDIEMKSEHHYTLVFNAFVFMQIFNEINSRKCNDEMNVFENFFQNSIFSLVILFTLVMQVLMVELFGPFAETEPLSFIEWMFTIGIGFLSLPLGHVIRCIPVDYYVGSIDIHPDTFKGAKLDKDYDFVKAIAAINAEQDAANGDFGDMEKLVNH